jgi:acetolactate synthase I/II/III large subunit
MRAADQIVATLKAHGITRVYCVPGESYLALLDAFCDSGITVVVCRHEGGAGFMACAEAKLIGKPAVFLASRGPGATNASIAIHMAEQDALPVILMLGQVSREERMRGVFQEVDYTSFFADMAKGVYEINDGARVRELLARGLRQAQEGVQGPVVFSLPEDMLRDEVEDLPPLVYPLPVLTHGIDDVARVQSLIDAAQRPIVVAGAVLRTDAGKLALKRFAEAQRIPVAVTWKNQDVFDNSSPLYAGHLGFGNPQSHRDILADADLVLAFGTRLGDVATLGYSFPEAPDPRQTVVHVYPDQRPLGRVINTACPIVADPASLLAALSQSARVVSSGRETWVSRLSTYTQHAQVFTPRNPTDGIDFGEVIMALAAQAPANCTITTDAGNMSTWVHRHWKMTPQNMLIGGIVGAMGLGVPAAVAAAIVQPQRMAICIVGDGGVLMTGNELATAIAYGATPKIVISDNGIYGTIRTHQEREYPGRVSGTHLVNPDYVAWANAFGVVSYRISLGDDIAATVKAFLAEPGATVLHVKSSRQSLSAFGVLKAPDAHAPTSSS